MTPHPLAKEAAKDIQDWAERDSDIVGMTRDELINAQAQLIQETAVRPIIEKGDELDKELTRILAGETIQAEDWVRAKRAISAWRDLKEGCGEQAKTDS